jgi:NlpC/P60 family putative phage cell wall peptidase
MQVLAQQGAAIADAVSRSDIVAEARSWIDTPYRHRASLKDAGAACLGLIRGAFRTFYGAEKEPISPYSPNWSEETGQQTLRDAARRHWVEIDAAPSLPRS